MQLEALMSILNDGKYMSKSVNLCEDTIASKSFRATLQRAKEEVCASDAPLCEAGGSPTSEETPVILR